MWRPFYPYLLNKNFLKEVDELRERHEHIKITSLSWQEEDPLQELQGYVTGGSINKNGKSSVRRTGSLSLEADDKIYKITNVNNIISVNKKIAIEVGFTNTTSRYKEYEIIWIPLGVYIIKTASINHGTNGLKISLSISDKMCLLNGDVGGLFPAVTNLSEIVILNEYGEKTGSEQIILEDIIRNVVYEYGGIQLGQIVIENLERTAKAQLKWNGNTPLYYWEKKVDKGKIQKFFSIDDNSEASDENKKIYEPGDPVGYKVVDFTWTGAEPLKANAGESVTSVLDKIANALGQFEFFFDTYGFFHFKKKDEYKNFQEFNNNIDLKNIDYIPSKNDNIYSYEFNDANIITAYQNNPQYMNIKNDFIVWGQKKVVGATVPIRYHLAIDNKPEVTGNKYLFEYNGDIIAKKEDDGNEIELSSDYLITELPFKYSLNVGDIIYITIKGKITTDNTQSHFGCWPTDQTGANYGQAVCVGTYGNDFVYALTVKITQAIKDKNPSSIKIFNGSNQNDPRSKGCIKSIKVEKIFGFKQLLVNKTKFDTEQTKVTRPNKADGIYYGSVKAPEIWDEERQMYVTILNPKFAYFQPTDWRGELFAQSQFIGESYYSNPYTAELISEFPKIYNLFTKQTGTENEYQYPVYEGDYFSIEESDYDYLYFFDFVDIRNNKNISPQDLSVQNIGRRTKVVNDSSINCIFPPEIPDLMFILAGTENTDEERDWADAQGYDFYQVSPELFEQMSLSTAFNSAYDKAVDLLYQHSKYAETISITCLPIYHLEPNTKIKVYDEESNINGDYIAESFTLQLAPGGTMTISCSKPIEKM